VRVRCGACGGEQSAADLARCAAAAERRLEACLEACQRDALEGRAALGAFLGSAEAARLSRAHHLLYQAHAAAAVACRCMGDHDARAHHLRQGARAPPSLVLIGHAASLTPY
jgi:hypothetical protein